MKKQRFNRNKEKKKARQVYLGHCQLYYFIGYNMNQCVTSDTCRQENISKHTLSLNCILKICFKILLYFPVSKTCKKLCTQSRFTMIPTEYISVGIRQSIGHCALNIAHWALGIEHWALCIEHCALDIVHWTLCIGNCALGIRH